MRVLLLTSRVPFPADGGYAIVVYNTIKGLVEHGCDVTLFSLNPTKHYVNTRDIQDPLFRKIKFVQHKIDDRINPKDAFLNLFTQQSYNISRFYDPNCSQKIIYLLKKNQFDVVQFEGLQVTLYLETIKANSNAKTIYRAHNIEHQIWRRLTHNENFFLRKMYLALLSRRLKKFEYKILNNFDLLLAISFVDEHFFKNIGCKTPIISLPVALHLANYQQEFSLSPYKSIGYIGTMDWRPNLEGINWFLETVWPLIERLDSGITFHLAGKNSPKELFNLKSPSFIMDGEVDDAMQFIAVQHVLVFPLLSGSGMRVKIIEAMALGKCIIATSIAAEGINYLHDKNILIADHADDFYKQILRCFTEKELITKIGANAKKLVENYHDNEKTSKHLVGIYKNLVEAKA
jgi:glycosyltransferase involved in cell wall biosynthesis